MALKRGNCYYASEAIYHILGGKAAGWKPMRVKLPDDMRWFLKHISGIILDPSRQQFGGYLPDYTLAKGAGFLTKTPSKRARNLMEMLTWQ